MLSNKTVGGGSFPGVAVAQELAGHQLADGQQLVLYHLFFFVLA